MTRPAIAVAAGGVVAGAIDIVYAWAYWAIAAGTSFTRILQSVAAGVQGPAAFRGGLASALLGLTLHFGIAVTVAVVYYQAARRLPALTRRPWLYGSLYGVAVYVVMNEVVLPLSAAGGGASDPKWIALTVVVHALGIGVPCAFAARAALSGRH